MKDQWFRWEREASVHLLFPTLEAFYKPLYKYSGVSAPTMVLIFEKGLVTWCIKEDEFMDYGRKLLNIYKNLYKEKKMVADIKNSLLRLKEVEYEQEKLDLKNLSANELIEKHKILYKSFIDYYTMGAIGTPLSFVAESDLKIKGLTDEELNALTTPYAISYVSEADEYLLKTKNIKGFMEKYFWINNNYSGTEIIRREEVNDRLDSLLQKRFTLEKSSKIKPKIKLTKIEKRLVELLKNYSIYKDDRKKEILIYLHYVDRILKETARRMNFGINEIKASTPYEIADTLNGELTEKRLKDRLKFFVIVWEKHKSRASLLEKSSARLWEQKTLSKIGSDIKVIKGTTASLGKVKGKVRILLKAGDCDQLKNGEILVTFMTSPDFMPAIRKCSAIVTNLGGVTSHAAIISRELKIPCIVGTKIATQVLKTGDLVEVNANKGVVTFLK